MTKATVRAFLFSLTGRLTRFDAKNEQKMLAQGRNHNIYALGHYLEAVHTLEKKLARYLDRDDPEAMEALKQALSLGFTHSGYGDAAKFYLPPVNQVVKMINLWLVDGKMPKYGSSLQSRVVRLAHKVPALRKYLLPLVAKTSAVKWFSTLSDDARKAVFATMNDMENEVLKFWATAQKLGPQSGSTSVGAGDMDYVFKATALESFLSALNQGKDPFEANTWAKAEAKKAIQKWNSTGSKQRPNLARSRTGILYAVSHMDDAIDYYQKRIEMAANQGRLANKKAAYIHIDDDTLDHLVQVEAESLGLESYYSGSATPKLKQFIAKYEVILQEVLLEWVSEHPLLKMETESPEDQVAALMNVHSRFGQASYLVLMTLRGEGVGIWDGSWQHFMPKNEILQLQKVLKVRLRRYAGDGLINNAIRDAAYETAEEASVRFFA
jgi:tetratricopeptide (TPR) repeat protein